MFYVGQKVVCVEDRPHMFYKRGSPAMDGLRKDTVYTVRAVGIDPHWKTPALWLVEIVRPIRGSKTEIGYDPRRFRPVVERKTDISIFKEILNNPRIRIPEDA